MVVSVRGAVQVDENSREHIFRGIQELVSELCEKNQITEEMLISIQCSQTRDLDEANPATGLRELGFSSVPLWCVQELYVKGGMERVIRVLFTLNWEGCEPPCPVYLRGAKALRPDIS